MADGKADGMTEKFMGWAMIVVVFLVCIFIVYKVSTPEVHSAIRWVRYAEMWVVSLVTPDSYIAPLPGTNEFTMNELLEITAEKPKNKIDVGMVKGFTAAALIPYKWFFSGIIMLIGIWAYLKGPGTQYVEIFNLNSFIKFQAKHFKIISPFVDFNPSDQPPRAPGSPVPAELPIFAEALGPEEWLAYYEIPVHDDAIDEKETFKMFARQLGARWKGPAKLAPYKQVLLASFCLKASRKREQADEMLGRLASCWSHDKGLQLSREKGLVKEARKVLKNKDLSHKLLKNCNQHAWQTTALLRALLTARDEGGVLAPSQFVWLRAHDRELWYPLNNLGRKSNHMEAIGAMAHFRMEKRSKRPIPKPKVQDAVDSIVEYMKSDIARPIPKLDYSQSKNKRGIKKLKTA